MSDVIREYVEQDPTTIVTPLDLTPEEKDAMAESLSKQRAQFVVDAIAIELTTRKSAHELRLAEMTEEKDNIDDELSVIQLALGNAHEARVPTLTLPTAEIKSRFDSMLTLSEIELVEQIPENSGFVLRINEAHQTSFGSDWVDNHRSQLREIFGDRVGVLTRALVVINRSAFSFRLGEDVVETKFIEGNRRTIVGSVHVKKPKEFIMYMLGVTNFGLKSAAAVMAIAEIQKLPEFAGTRE